MSTEPYYSDESVTFWHGDALDVLRRLPDDSVDAVITDPPYSSGGFVRSDRIQDVHTKYVNSDQMAMGTGGATLAAFAGDNRDQRGYGYWCALWLGECLRILKSGGAAALFTDWRQLPMTTDALQAGGFVWRGIVPWHKPSGRPTQGRYSNTCEYVVWGSKGPRELGALDGDLIEAGQCRTQKPLEVMRKLVRIAPKGGAVLDPFAGAGTTGVAAVLEGRRFVGVELTEHFARVASERITTAARGYRDDGVQGVLLLEDGGGTA